MASSRLERRELRENQEPVSGDLALPGQFGGSCGHAQRRAGS